jgi:hypothetical protein
MFHRRIIVTSPVRLGEKCLRVPFLVDTGAPSTYLHHLGVKKFIGDGNAILRQYTISIGGTEFEAETHDSSETHNSSVGAVAYVNILGMDFLDDASPVLLDYFSIAFAKKYGPEVVDVWVTDGMVSFPAKPKKPQVAYLKAAIKEYGMYTSLDPTSIVIKDPATGTVMGDKDPLHAGVKYLYELPSTK